MEEKRRVPAEWEPQNDVLITLPDQTTDWNYMLPDVLECYRDLAQAISCEQPLCVVCSNEIEASALLGTKNIRYLELPLNDTWIRDYGPISCRIRGKMQKLDFAFNGWGLKFAADKDNRITAGMAAAGIIENVEDNLDYVLEGGSIESDGKGTILTTSRCLLSANRNGNLGRNRIECELRHRLGADRVLWLDYGFLEGDDTDSHIDTLARFAPHDTIIYVCTDNKEYGSYDEFKLMERQLHTFRTADGLPYRLVELPLPDPIRDERDGELLPATYANFLIMNKCVLVPIYGQPKNDLRAMKIIEKCFPGRVVKGVDCQALIRQHGSLHCATMQLHI